MVFAETTFHENFMWFRCPYSKYKASGVFYVANTYLVKFIGSRWANSQHKASASFHAESSVVLRD